MKQPSGRRRLARVIAGPRVDERGFSIIEFIIAITLLVIVIAATSQALTGAVRVSGNVRQRVVATNLATQTLEGLRATANTAYASIPISTTTLAPQILDGTTFTVTQIVEWEALGATTNACDAGSKAGLVLRATAVVSWPGSATTVQSSTLLAPPLGAYNQLAGAVGIRVFNANGKGNALVVVTAMSGATAIQSITTTSDGCAFFDSLPAGIPYTFTIVQALPYGVDGQEQHLSTTGIITPAIGSTFQNPPVSYDDAATIIYGFVPLSPPVATGLSVSVANASLNSKFFTFPVVGAGPVYTLPTSVFPYPTGYSLFAGDCADADPSGKDSTNTPFYPPPTLTTLTVTPGGTTAGSVALFPLNIKVIKNDLSPASTAGLNSVSNTPATTNPVACPFGFPAYTLTTADGGGISNTGVGLGHLTITATKSGKTGTAYVWVQPDGLYMADPVSGAKGALVYLFAAPTSLTIKLGP